MTFDEVYQENRGRVYGICLRMLGNQSDAEDVMQEVFIRVYQNLDTFRGESALKTWLYRVTVNVALMYMRKRRVRSRVQAVDPEMLQTIAEQHIQRGIALVDEIAVKQAVAQLPPGYRTVLILHDVEGFEHEEIGQMLGIAEGSSKSQLHKARKNMRNFLGI